MKRILLTLTLSITTGAAFAQCTAGFTWSQSQPNVIDFVNTTTPQNPGNQYYWDFGDTLSGFGSGPLQHTYYVPGTYYACLYVLDSLWQMQCSFCDSVVVTGTVLCTMSSSPGTLNASCPTCADGQAGIAPVGGTAPYTYAWSNGGTTASITGLLPGQYSCCITDAAGCTSCDTVNVSSNNSTSCWMYTVLNSPAQGWLHAVAHLYGVSNSTSVTWDFGDLSSGTGASVFHQYAQAGSYAVCAYLYDSLTLCTYTHCDTVFIGATPQNCYAGFYVQPDSANPNQAWIFNFSSGPSTMTYEWYWGDNTPVDTGAYPTHVYQSTGSYWITLIVTDPVSQCADTVSQSLWVPRLTQQASLAPYYVNVIPPMTMGISQNAGSESWTLFPNPVNDVLNVGNAHSTDNFIVTDLTGRVVLSGALNSNTISVSSLTGGTYLFTLISEDGTSSSKRFIRN